MTKQYKIFQCFQKLIFYIFQNGGSRFKRRSLQPPSRDSMYRALVNHTNIIERQKLILEQLSTQVKELKIKSVVQVRIIGSSLTLAKMLRAEKCKQQAKMHKKNYRQLLNKKFFEQLWKVVENTKVVHYFDNSKGNFFSRPKSQQFG